MNSSLVARRDCPIYVASAPVVASLSVLPLLTSQARHDLVLPQLRTSITSPSKEMDEDSEKLKPSNGGPSLEDAPSTQHIDQEKRSLPEPRQEQVNERYIIETFHLGLLKALAAGISASVNVQSDHDAFITTGASLKDQMVAGCDRLLASYEKRIETIAQLIQYGKKIRELYEKNGGKYKRHMRMAECIANWAAGDPTGNKSEEALVGDLKDAGEFNEREAKAMVLIYRDLKKEREERPEEVPKMLQKNEESLIEPLLEGMEKL
ncbi:MAG: hypothetical protein M1820_005943 [Bogoriella megaspora]|nr:MAG: hypothetical protein M1820_005943 [Bogoriella megaspora]